jgi:hypothetical protein
LLRAGCFQVPHRLRTVGEQAVVESGIAFVQSLAAEMPVGVRSAEAGELVRIVFGLGPLGRGADGRKYCVIAP